MIIISSKAANKRNTAGMVTKDGGRIRKASKVNTVSKTSKVRTKRDRTTDKTVTSTATSMSRPENMATLVISKNTRIQRSTTTLVIRRANKPFPCRPPAGVVE